MKKNENANPATEPKQPLPEERRKKIRAEWEGLTEAEMWKRLSCVAEETAELMGVCNKRCCVKVGQGTARGAGEALFLLSKCAHALGEVQDKLEAIGYLARHLHQDEADAKGNG